VRHKLLDLLGDLALLGMPLKAEVKAHKAGHALHVKFLRALKEAENGNSNIGTVE
jgi:UDP-3-O-acyl-N-acetylglucosamine deacetylase